FRSRNRCAVFRRLPPGTAGGPGRIGSVSAGAGVGDDPDVLVVQFCWAVRGAGVVLCREGEEVVVEGGRLVGCELCVDRRDWSEGFLVVLAVSARPARYPLGVGAWRDPQ